MNVFAVIDTNVLISAMMKTGSIPDLVMQEALKGRIIPVVNKEIMDEYEEVLKRKKFKFDPRDVRALMTELRKRAVYGDAAMVEDFIPDKKDVVFYAVTMEKREESDAYLVTGNIRHFPEKPFVVTPREMFEILKNMEESRK